MFACILELPTKEKKLIKLTYPSEIRIQRHVKIKSHANSYNPEWNACFKKHVVPLGNK